MANADQLRKAVLDCAKRAWESEPDDRDKRLHSFIARLSGRMEHLGEQELDTTLWELFGNGPSAPRPSSAADSTVVSTPS